MSRLKTILFTEVAEVVSVGFPFCGFKILSGFALFSTHYLFLQLVAGFLIALGVLDVFINTINLLGLILKQKRILDACAFTQATRFLSARRSSSEKYFQNLGNSLDVLVSLTLVAVMISGGFLKTFAACDLFTWNVCVIFNVMGAGLSRFGRSLRAQM